MFYGCAGATILCIIGLVVVCCCCMRQRRTLNKLRKNDTTLSNPYVNSERNNHHVVGFPSPLQLDTFVVKPESPYDMPDLVETLPEEPDVSYVTVVDGNDVDSPYATVKGNEGADATCDDEEEPPSPDYTNASVFQIDPYQQLMPATRNVEDHYTSLISKEKNEESGNEATV